MFLDVDNNNDVFGNRLELVLPCMMYLLDNNNFQTARYFKLFCMMMFLEIVLERSVYFWTGVVLQNTGICICNICKCMWKWTTLFFVLLQLEFATNSGEQYACMHVLGSSMLHKGIKETETTRHSG